MTTPRYKMPSIYKEVQNYIWYVDFHDSYLLSCNEHIEVPREMCNIVLVMHHGSLFNGFVSHIWCFLIYTQERVSKCFIKSSPRLYLLLALGWKDLFFRA